MIDEPFSVAILLHKGVARRNILDFAIVNDPNGANSCIGDLLAADYHVALKHDPECPARVLWALRSYWDAFAK